MPFSRAKGKLFFFSLKTKIFRGRSRRDEKRSRGNLPRERFFSFFAEAKNYAQKIRISSCAVSTRRNIVSG